MMSRVNSPAEMGVCEVREMYAIEWHTASIGVRVAGINVKSQIHWPYVKTLENWGPRRYRQTPRTSYTPAPRLVNEWGRAYPGCYKQALA